MLFGKTYLVTYYGFYSCADLSRQYALASIMTLPPTLGSFSINPTANSGLITYAIVETNKENKIVRRTILSRNNWILQMKGEQKSKANIEGVDLWSKHEIGDCFWMLDPNLDKYIAQNCETKVNIDDLWRLRYNRNWSTDRIKLLDLNIVGGWVYNPFRPNWPQVQILQNYGIIFISDFWRGNVPAPERLAESQLAGKPTNLQANICYLRIKMK